MTRDEFIEKAKLKHGDKYDYSLVEYVNNKTKVCIICSTHGEFWQIPGGHLSGKSCPKCANRNITTEDFVKKARLVHGDKYDYSKVNYIKSTITVCIICGIHGEFWQTPSSHLSKHGCPNCCKNKKMTTSDFIEKSIIKHNNKYDYSKVEYLDTGTKVCITCPEHGEFWQTPENHLQGYNCGKCAKNFMNNDYFIELSNLRHNNKYDYSKIKYINMNTKISIICPEHGVFLQLPCDHIKGAGCKKCANQYMDLELFIEKSNLIHNNKFSYSKVKYKNTITKVIISCPIHGDFQQIPGSHMGGNGCPKCKQSKGERVIENFLNENNIINIHNHKFNDCIDKRTLPFDFFLPYKNICIEYDGGQHFFSVVWFGGDNTFDDRVKKDTIKTKYCIDNNIKLIRIPYTEFNNIEEILKKELKL